MEARYDEVTRMLAALEEAIDGYEDFRGELDALRDYMDSGAWQKVLLPAGVKGAPKLKKASKDVGLRMFPMHAEIINEHGDADALLIAEWARRRGV
jgi:hypothetical protein